MYVAAAERSGVERARLGGTLQNDILKEYQAQKEFIFPPRPSMRLVADTIRFCTAEMPRLHPVSISGYHIREAGSTAAQELAFTLANGFAYVEAAWPPGLASTTSRRACRSSSTRTSTSSRRSPSTARRGASGPGGCTTATAPPRPLARSCGSTRRPPGCRSPRSSPRSTSSAPRSRRSPACSAARRACTPNSMDEALALPTEKAARLALRTQQVIADETGVANVADPLGGSWFVEELTDQLEARPRRCSPTSTSEGAARCSRACCAAIEDGWFAGEIADAAYEFSRKLDAGRHRMVGVNVALEGNDEPPPDTLRIGPEVEAEQLRRLTKVKAERDARQVADATGGCVRPPPNPTTNVMPALIDAVQVSATLGEVVGALADEFGRYYEVAGALSRPARRGVSRSQAVISSRGAPGENTFATPACSSAGEVVVGDDPAAEHDHVVEAASPRARPPCAGTASGARPRAPTARPRRRPPAGSPPAIPRGCLLETEVDHLEPGVAQRSGDDLHAAVVAVEAGFGDDHPVGHAASVVGRPTAGPATMRSTSRVRWTWPVAGVRGSSSTSSSRRGCLNAGERARRSARAARRGRGRRRIPGGATTTAHTTSPHCGSGMPTTATSATAGCVASTASTSTGRDRLAAGAHHVARPPDDRQVALVVEHAEVAGVVPAVARAPRRWRRAASKYPSMRSSLRDAHLAASVEAQLPTPGCGSPTLPGLRRGRRRPGASCPGRPRSTRRRRA